MKFFVNENVIFTRAADKNLNGVTGKVIGTFSKDYIILFDLIPRNYNPAIVIPGYCLEKVGENHE